MSRENSLEEWSAKYAGLEEPIGIVAETKHVALASTICGIAALSILISFAIFVGYALNSGVFK